MPTGDDVMEVRILHKQGMSIRGIDRALGVGRSTVRKFLREPDLEPGYGPRAGRGSKLDPFKGYVRKRIGEASPRRLPVDAGL